GRSLSAFFFFQAEDGIRDFHVTGVQTCALPISTYQGRTRREYPTLMAYLPPLVEADVQEFLLSELAPAYAASMVPDPVTGISYRSEERRVGKECRSRRTPDRVRKDQEPSEVHCG